MAKYVVCGLITSSTSCSVMALEVWQILNRNRQIIKNVIVKHSQFTRSDSGLSRKSNILVIMTLYIFTSTMGQDEIVWDNVSFLWGNVRFLWANVKFFWGSLWFFYEVIWDCYMSHVKIRAWMIDLRSINSTLSYSQIEENYLFIIYSLKVWAKLFIHYLLIYLKMNKYVCIL